RKKKLEVVRVGARCREYKTLLLNRSRCWRGSSLLCQPMPRAGQAHQQIVGVETPLPITTRLIWVPHEVCLLFCRSDVVKFTIVDNQSAVGRGGQNIDVAMVPANLFL